MKIFVAVVLMWVAAGTAWADPTKEDWERYAQPTVDMFGGCARGEVDRAWETTAPAEDIAHAAVTTCERNLEPLWDILAKEPFGAGKQEIAETLEQLKVEVFDAAKADVENRRK